MKLQNLIYATMVACAFSACSNDDDPNIPDPALEMDATLTVAFSSVGNNGSTLKSLTKADDNQYNTIGKIGIAVFNAGAMSPSMAEGALIGYAEQDNSAGADTTACVSVKSGVVKVLVVANPTADMFKSYNTYAGYLTAISDASIDENNLLMSSNAYDITVAKGRNTIATNASTVFGEDNKGTVAATENIKVYRNVARVEVPKIIVNPRSGFGKEGQYAKFTLKSIYVSNVRSSVSVFGKADNFWCPVVNTGADLITGNTIYGNQGIYSKYIKLFSSENVIDYSGTTAEKTFPDARIFVYDNSSTSTIVSPKDNATLLVIRGDYEYRAVEGGEIIKSEDAYWTTVINNTDPVSGDAGFPSHCGVLRNVKYLLNVTITGPGSGSEDPESNAASLTSKIEVVPWGQVVLNPDID
ncbi:hypothetical protein HMPREF1212_01822 [Parabacteroides sp. HGS0025]|uniref:fimbrial protein n=1 Tax=Parabacteroides sp. HGS0025 TaxID=1078087 RepID=UPI000617148D|nr:fimbrial protein [Parabacteroides sp. HGS0025]KKB51093.1 hypothetical protein HMPREF1212_01822 [Parabacteroides sp. HGS0025]